MRIGRGRIAPGSRRWDRQKELDKERGYSMSDFCSNNVHANGRDNEAERFSVGTAYVVKVFDRRTAQ